MSESNGGGKVIMVKNWHALLVLIGWLVISVLQFAYLRADTTQNTRDIEQVKRDRVTKDRFDEYQQDIQRRLQRIEDKLDRDRALRSIH